MKPTIHQLAAVVVAVTAPIILAPVLHASKRPDAGAVVAWGVVFVIAMILVTPWLLRWTAFRGWYGWTDALSNQQREAISHRNLSLFYKTGFADGYEARVMPYAWRITWTVCVLVAGPEVLTGHIERPELVALVAFSAWYPMGVLFVVLASLPLGRLIRQSVQKRRR